MAWLSRPCHVLVYTVRYLAPHSSHSISLLTADAAAALPLRRSFAPFKKVSAIAMCARVSLNAIYCTLAHIYSLYYYIAQSRNTWKCKHVQIDK